MEHFGPIAGPAGQATADRAIPLVSFCDIPLSQTSHHMDEYGRFAIGLRKEWGIRNRLAPVIYHHAHSPTVQSIQTALQWLARNANIRDAAESEATLVRLGCYFKPYEGDSFRDRTQHRRVVFYDEREWRFVPESALTLPTIPLPEWQKMNNGVPPKYREAAWESGKLSFEPSDVKYLVVAKEEDILATIRGIRDIKGKKYSEDEIAMLSSRIISAEQIAQDF